MTAAPLAQTPVAISQVPPPVEPVETMPVATPPPDSLNERIEAEKPNPDKPSADNTDAPWSLGEKLKSVPWYWYALLGVGVVAVLWKTGVIKKVFGNLR